MNNNKKVAPNLNILKLTFTYFSTGVILFLIAMLMAIWFIPEFIHLQSFRNPKGWLLTHLLLLGWATMVAMGASFQITQVIMRTSLFSKRLGYSQFILYLFGIICLIIGFFNDVRLIVFGGISIVFAAILYVLNLGMTFMRRKEWNLFVFGVSLSLIEFLMTIFLGVGMGIQSAFRWKVDYYETFFQSHLWFGIAGWLSGLIIVYSFKLLPMFYVSAKKVTSSTYWIVALYHVGIWLQILSIWTPSKGIQLLGTITMLFSLSWFVIYIFMIRKQRRKGKIPVGTVKVAFLLIPIFFLLFMGWSVLNYLGVTSFYIQGMLIVSIILGWFPATILSYLYKIVPFLWWPYRYRTKEQRKSAVLLYEMLPARRMTLELYGYLIGIFVVIVGFFLSISTVAIIGQIAASLFLIVYIWELSHVFRY